MIWKTLHPSFNQIHRAEEDAPKAKKVIAALLQLAYLREFPNANGSNCDHLFFEKLMEDRQNAILWVGLSSCSDALAELQVVLCASICFALFLPV